MNAEKDKAIAHDIANWAVHPSQREALAGQIECALATARKEARQAAFREAVDALKAHQQAVRDRHYGVITLAIEAVEALERAATTDTDKTERG